MPTLAELVPIVSSVGFPIFVAYYLMTVTTKILGEVRDVVIEHTSETRALRESIERAGLAASTHR